MLKQIWGHLLLPSDQGRIKYTCVLLNRYFTNLLSKTSKNRDFRTSQGGSLQCLIILEKCSLWHVQVICTILTCNLNLFCCKLSPLLPLLGFDLNWLENNLFFLTSSHSCSFTFIFYLSWCAVPQTGCNITCAKQNGRVPSYGLSGVHPIILWWLFFITRWHCWLIFSLFIFFSELLLSLWYTTLRVLPKCRALFFVSVELPPIVFRPFLHFVKIIFFITKLVWNIHLSARESCEAWERF